jgi:hypothetical protein
VKEDIITDPFLTQAATYFIMKQFIREANWSIEMLFSRDCDTEWTFNNDNWVATKFNFERYLQDLTTLN